MKQKGLKKCVTVAFAQINKKKFFCSTVVRVLDYFTCTRTILINSVLYLPSDRTVGPRVEPGTGGL